MSQRALLIIVGTKAQFIKTAPILRELDRKAIPYRLIYTGQHSETFDLLEAAFETRSPDDELVPGTEASTHLSFLSWSIRFWRAVFKRIGAWRGMPGGMVHGDTASTLFGAMALRLAGVPVLHVEAGLRSTRLTEPFPEEIVRRIVSRLTAVHFAPDALAVGNLSRAPGSVVNTHGNTLRDSLRLAVAGFDELPQTGGSGGYVIFSIHRSENLGRKDDFDLLMGQVIGAASIASVKFVLHPATRERIKSSGWLQRLQAQPSLELMNRMDYPDFVKLLLGSSCLLTDGGSNQEEAAMLGLPTMLLRRATERPDGIGDGIELSYLDPEKIEGFVRKFAATTWSLRPIEGVSPSEMIATYAGQLLRHPDSVKPEK